MPRWMQTSTTRWPRVCVSSFSNGSLRHMEALLKNRTSKLFVINRTIKIVHANLSRMSICSAKNYVNQRRNLRPLILFSAQSNSAILRWVHFPRGKHLQPDKKLIKIGAWSLRNSLITFRVNLMRNHYLSRHL